MLPINAVHSRIQIEPCQCLCIHTEENQSLLTIKVLTLNILQKIHFPYLALLSHEVKQLLVLCDAFLFDA